MVEVGNGEGKTPLAEILRHDDAHMSPSFAFMLAELDHPQFPAPIGVLRDVHHPSYEERTLGFDRGPAVPSLSSLWNQGDTWTIDSIGGDAEK